MGGRSTFSHLWHTLLAFNIKEGRLGEADKLYQLIHLIEPSSVHFNHQHSSENTDILGTAPLEAFSHHEK